MTLRLGYVEGATPDRWVARWRERERTRLELVPLVEADQRAALDESRVDLALVRLPLDRDGLHLIRLYDEQPVAVAAAGHLISLADEVTSADLADETVVYGGPGGSPVSAAEAVAAVAGGAGVALMPMSVARLHHRRDVVRRPVTDLPATTVGLAWRTDLAPATEELVQRFVGVVRGRTANSSRGRR